MKRAVLFFDVASTGHLPLIQEVAASGALPIVNHAGMAKLLAASGVEFRMWDEFVSVRAAQTVQAKLTQILNSLSNALECPEVLEAFNSRFGSFLPATGGDFFQTLTALLATELLVIETFENLSEQVPISLIVFGCDNNHAERALIGIARMKRVPTLQLEHAISNDTLARVAGETSTTHSDYVAHFGPRAHDLMVGLGNDSARLVATGAPLWDSLYRESARMDAGVARRQLGLDPARPVVVLCTQYSEGVCAFYGMECLRRLEIHEAVIQAVARCSLRPQLVVRPHPHEIRSDEVGPEERAALEKAYARWAADQGAPSVRLIQDHKLAVIAAADLVIVEDESCVIPEIMILGRPVAMVRRFEKSVVYGEEDGIVVVRDAKLPALLEVLLQSPRLQEEIIQRQRQALSQLNYGNDGGATRRVAALIRRLSTGRSTRASLLRDDEDQIAVAVE